MNISNYSIPEIAAAMRLMRLTIYPTTLMLGLIGNTLVCILIIWSHKREKHSKAPRYFIFNLAISDLLVLILFIPFDMTYLESDHLMWNFGKLHVQTCKHSHLYIRGCLGDNDGLHQRGEIPQHCPSYERNVSGQNDLFHHIDYLDLCCSNYGSVFWRPGGVFRWSLLNQREMVAKPILV